MFKVQLKDDQDRWLFYLFLWLFCAYTVPNKIILFTPTPVEKTFIDDWIAPSSHWVWVYVSFYFLSFGAFLFVKKEFTKRLIFISYSLAGLLACLIFLIYPTSIVRELYPLPTDQSLSDKVLQLIRGFDTSINCTPSLHVALSLMATFSIFSESTRHGLAALFWFVLICISTMATKQHYFYDVLTGVLLGIVFWFISFFYLKNSKS